MKHLFAAALSATALLFAHAAYAQDTDVSFSIVKLTAGINVIEAEVADTEAEREQGLMYRKSLPLNGGMLFDFKADVLKTCMWMKNTDLPLSVAFMDSEGVILNIEDMQPQTLDNHCSAEGKAVRYALEMNLGWFREKHIGVGAKISKAPSSGL